MIQVLVEALLLTETVKNGHWVYEGKVLHLLMSCEEEELRRVVEGGMPREKREEVEGWLRALVEEVE